MSYLLSKEEIKIYVTNWLSKVEMTTTLYKLQVGQGGTTARSAIIKADKGSRSKNSIK